MTERSLLAAALRYAERGWYVFPLGVGSKRPHFELLPAADPSRPKSEKNTATYKPFAEHAASSEQIRKWWTQAPDANIGLICGYQSGVIVVDLDPNKRDKSGGYLLPDARRQVLLDREGFEVTPLLVKTTSGGWHLYYRHPRAPTPVVTQHGHSKGDGVDVQGGKLAYVVAPPSVYGGKRYAWQTGDGADLPPPPLWTIAQQDTSDTRVYTGHWYSLALATDLPEGGNEAGHGRNKTLRSLALSDAKRGIELDRSIAGLGNWNELRCKPPLGGADVYRQIVHMYEKADQDMGRDGSNAIRLRYNGPAFPLDTLRNAAPRLFRWVSVMATERGCHVDMAACAAILGMGSAATHYQIAIEGIPKWRPPAHLWGTIVADSGTKKSAVFQAITDALQPTRDVLERIARTWNAEIQTERDLLEQSKRDAKAAMTRAKTQEQRTTARDMLAQANLDLAELPRELHASWITSDTTPEAFQQKMAANGWVGLLSEEGADVLKGFFGHYSGKADISGILKGYDGGSTDIDRKSDGHTTIKRALAAMMILTQPSVLSELSSTEAEDRGFLARMMFCVPPPQQSKPPKLAHVEDPDQVYSDFGTMICGMYFGGRAKYLRAVRDSSSYVPEFEALDMIDVSSFGDDTAGKRGRPTKPIIMPDRRRLIPPKLRELIEIRVPREVWAQLSEFQSEMSAHSQVGAQHYGARSWCKKAGEHATRIAVVLELAESAGEARELTPAKAAAAIRLVREYFLPQYYAALDRMNSPRVADMAIHVLQRFHDHESFTVSALADELRCTTEAATALVQWLDYRGTLHVKGRGRNLVCKVLAGVDY